MRSFSLRGPGADPPAVAPGELGRHREKRTESGARRSCVNNLLSHFPKSHLSGTQTNEEECISLVETNGEGLPRVGCRC